MTTITTHYGYQVYDVARGMERRAICHGYRGTRETLDVAEADAREHHLRMYPTLAQVIDIHEISRAYDGDVLIAEEWGPVVKRIGN